MSETSMCSIIEIKDGGQTERMGGNKVLNIKIAVDCPGRNAHFEINESSLSYLSLDELIKLRNAFNLAIQVCVGI